MWFWRNKPMSPEDREIRDSILSLKTLKYHEGRVSIDPSEVLDRPGYLEARRQAADLVHGRSTPPAEPTSSADWALIDASGMDNFLSELSESLHRSRCQGLTLSEALDQLKLIPGETVK
jgi:hypothetical protein